MSWWFFSLKSPEEKQTRCTLLKFNSSPLKNDCWKTRLSFWGPVYFQGRTVKLPGGKRWLKCRSIQHVILSTTTVATTKSRGGWHACWVWWENAGVRFIFVLFGVFGGAKNGFKRWRKYDEIWWDNLFSFIHSIARVVNFFRTNPWFNAPIELGGLSSPGILIGFRGFKLSPQSHVSHETRAPGCLGYIGDCATQLYRDYNKL